jgi:hypothetical protein
LQLNLVKSLVNKASAALPGILFLPCPPAAFLDPAIFPRISNNRGLYIRVTTEFKVYILKK